MEILTVVYKIYFTPIQIHKISKGYLHLIIFLMCIQILYLNNIIKYLITIQITVRSD